MVILTNVAASMLGEGTKRGNDHTLILLSSALRGAILLHTSTEGCECVAEDYRRWLSVSRLKKVSHCGQQYYYQKIEKHPTKPYPWTVRGIAAHSAIEEWERSDRTIDPESYYVDVAWPEAYEKILEDTPDLKDWGKTPRVGSVKKDLEKRQEDGLKQVQTYVDRALEEEHLWRVVEMELEFKLEYPDFWIVGYIDQIREWIETGEKYIVDCKTGGDDSEDNRQLGTYRLGYFKTKGEWLDFGMYYYPKLDRYSDDIDLSIYTEDYLLDQFTKLDMILENKIFLPNPSFKNCQFCDFTDLCAEAKLK